MPPTWRPGSTSTVAGAGLVRGDRGRHARRRRAVDGDVGHTNGSSNARPVAASRRAPERRGGRSSSLLGAPRPAVRVDDLDQLARGAAPTACAGAPSGRPRRASPSTPRGRRGCPRRRRGTRPRPRAGTRRARRPARARPTGTAARRRSRGTSARSRRLARPASAPRTCRGDGRVAPSSRAASTIASRGRLRPRTTGSSTDSTPCRARELDEPLATSRCARRAARRRAR